MQVNIEKKHVYILSTLFILVIGTFVYAGTANYLTGAATSGADSADAFGHDLVCVSAKKVYGESTASIVSSTDNVDYSVNSVISSASRAEIECNIANGWIMTGCSAWTGDGKEQMTESGNGCKGDEAGTPQIYVRCCQVS